ncbi:unnamed protein product [Schistocephalus solidus]|uniref:SSD domain-containing protein n=1 Tax=Schistocephalus solidus TaxID=70667 RepID=A0A183SPU4_SCHSO|nr:unnamed protein product [Schistocephalus solidus]
MCPWGLLSPVLLPNSSLRKNPPDTTERDMAKSEGHSLQGPKRLGKTGSRLQSTQLLTDPQRTTDSSAPAPVKVTCTSILKRHYYSTMVNLLPKEEILPPDSCFQVDKSPLEKVQTHESVQKSTPLQTGFAKDDTQYPQVENEIFFQEMDRYEEDICQGRVSFQAYLTYIAVRGILLTVIAVISYAVYASTMAFRNKWLQKFADDENLLVAGKILMDPAANQNARYQAAQDLLSISHYYLSVYSWLGLVLTVCVCVFVITSVVSSFKASKMLNCMFPTFTATFTVAMREDMPPGMAGFLITCGLTIADSLSLSWLVKRTAQMESSAVAIERIKEYTKVSSILLK